MAYANTTYTYNSGAAAPLVFTLPFEFLRDAHIKSKIDIAGDGTFVAETGFTVATDGNSVTFAAASTGGSAWVNGTTLVNVYRTTPIGDGDRIVDFQSGSVLASADLDDSALQGLYANQEAADTAAISMHLTGGDLAWDGDTKKIVDVVNPTLAQDAATKGYVDAVTAVSGNLPDVSGGAYDDNLIIVDAATDTWTAKTPAQTRTVLGLDDLYLNEALNLSDVASVATSRTNLGLGTAALVDAGVGAANVALNSSSKAIEVRHGALIAGCGFGDASFIVPYIATAGGPIGAGGLTDDVTRLTLANLVVVNESGDASPTLQDSGKALELPSVGDDLWKVSWGFGVVGNASGSIFVYHGLTDEDGNAIDGSTAALKHGRTLPDATTCWDFSSSKILDMSSQDAPIRISFRVWVSTEVNYGLFVAADSYLMVERLPGAAS